MENECEALPGVAYPGVRDNRSTINTKTGYDDYKIAICKNIVIFVTVKFYIFFIQASITYYYFFLNFDILCRKIVSIRYTC